MEGANSLRYLAMHFDRMLAYKTQVESTKLRCKKGLYALGAMDSKGIEQCHLFLLYQSVILSVIDNGLGLTTLSKSNLLKLDMVQIEAMRVIVGTTKDTPVETMRLPTGSAIHGNKTYDGANQSVSQCYVECQESTPRCCRRRKGAKTGGKSQVGQAERSIQHVCCLAQLKQVRDWEKRLVVFKPCYMYK